MDVDRDKTRQSDLLLDSCSGFVLVTIWFPGDYELTDHPVSVWSAAQVADAHTTGLFAKQAGMFYCSRKNITKLTLAMRRILDDSSAQLPVTDLG